MKFLASLWAGAPFLPPALALQLRISLLAALQSLVKQDNKNSSKYIKRHAEVSKSHCFPDPSAVSPAVLLATSHAAQARGATWEAQLRAQVSQYQCPGLFQGTWAGCFTCGDRETS